MGELDLNGPITEWELDDWSIDERNELSAALTDAHIAHQWESAVLLVASRHEDDVEDIMDEFENSLDPQESVERGVAKNLSQVAGKLSRNPADTNAIGKLQQILDQVENRSAPEDISQSEWRQIVDLATQIRDALVGGDRPDEVLAMDLANRLEAILS